MESGTKTLITFQVLVKARIEKVWKNWTTPEDIIRWNMASEDWHTPRAQIDLQVGGKFLSRMESKEGKMGFDFWGTYIKVEPEKLIEIKLGDGRKMTVTFEETEGATIVTEMFEPEDVNSLELQKKGWQAILDNFKKYAEAI